MRRLPAKLARCLVWLVVGLPTVTYASDVDLDRFDDLVDSARADWEVPGLAIAVVDDGELVVAEGYGVRRLGTSDPVDGDTLFAIGSTTKAMTAAILGTLVEEGRLGWDDPVAERLPGFRLEDPWVTREVTVRDLLTHRTGLGNADLIWYGHDRTPPEILALVPEIDAAYSMRSGFVYQNIMYLVAGEVAAEVAGSSWAELVQERLFDPLGMARTTPTLAASETLGNVASPHDRVDGTVVPIENEPVDSVAPAGSVWSSAREMSHWLRMLLANGRWEGEPVLEASTVDELLRPQTLVNLAAFYPAVRELDFTWSTYGLGWFQLDHRGRAVHFHTGSIDGMAAIVGLVPADDLGVVVLANLDHAEVRHALLWTVIELFGSGGATSRDWSTELEAIYDGLAEAAASSRAERDAGRVADAPASRDLASYAGRYTHALYGEVAVVASDDSLRLEAGARLAGELAHWHYDTFQVRFDRAWQGDDLVTFGLDAGGRVAALEMFGERFVRRPSDDSPGDLGGATGAEGRSENPAPACCFSNPRFHGVCRVDPSEDETCESVLAYLNNPRSVGKTYCGSTDVRGGWATVSCEEP